mgnify:CR=1 FL=1
MRRILDGVYRLSGGLAAAFLCLILVTVLAQVSLNITDKIAEMVSGQPVGLLIPSYADFAGYFLAAATFFALASSFRHGAHIRVTLFLLRLPSRIRQVCELWSVAVALALSAYFTWYMVRLTYDSWRFHDLSPGLVPIPIWIPQAAMVAGLFVLTLAAGDALLSLLRGGTPPYMAQDAELAQIMEE